MLIPVDVDRAAILATGHVEPVMPWVTAPDGKRSPGTVQEVDEATGHLMWTVHGLIPTDTRPVLVAVRVPARDCPQPQPYGPVAFERLVVNVRVGRDGKLGTYWSASGLAAPGAGGARRAAQEQAA